MSSQFQKRKSASPKSEHPAPKNGKSQEPNDSQCSPSSGKVVDGCSIGRKDISISHLQDMQITSELISKQNQTFEKEPNTCTVSSNSPAKKSETRGVLEAGCISYHQPTVSDDDDESGLEQALRAQFMRDMLYSTMLDGL